MTTTDISVKPAVLHFMRRKKYSLAEETTKTQTFTAVSENPKPTPQENKATPHKEEGEAPKDKSPAEKRVL